MPTLQAQTPPERSPGRASPRPSPVLDKIISRSHQIGYSAFLLYPTAILGETADAVFPTLLHLLISLPRKRYASPLRKVSVAPGSHRAPARASSGHDETAVPRSSGLRVPAVPPARPKLFLRLPNFSPLERRRRVAASGSSVLCRDGTERCSTDPGDGHPPVARRGWQPTPLPLPGGARTDPIPPTPRMRDGGAGCGAQGTRVAPSTHPRRSRGGGGGGVAGREGAGSDLRGAW